MLLHLQAGVLSLPHSSSASSSPPPPSSPSRHHIRMRLMSNQRRSDQPSPMPHKVFTTNFFHQQAHNDGSVTPSTKSSGHGGDSVKAELRRHVQSLHRPHRAMAAMRAHPVQQRRGSDANGIPSSPNGISSLDLILPSRNTLRLMEEYFRTYEEQLQHHQQQQTQASLNFTKSYIREMEELLKMRSGMESDTSSPTSMYDDLDMSFDSTINDLLLHPLHSHPRFHFQWLITLKSPITSKSIETLERMIAPYKVQHYLPESTFLVSMPYKWAVKVQEGITVKDDADTSIEGEDKGAKKAKKRGPVLFICMYHPSLKLQPNLVEELHQRWQRKMDKFQQQQASSTSYSRSQSPKAATFTRRIMAHDLRLTFTHPHFQPNATCIQRHLFPASHHDRRLMQQYVHKQTNYWNNHPRFIQAMEQATQEAIAKGADEFAKQSGGSIEFRSIGSNQVLVRLPGILPLPPKDSSLSPLSFPSDVTTDSSSSSSSSSFISFFLSRLLHHHSLQYMESSASATDYTVSNKHARFVIQADREHGSECMDTPGNGDLLSHVNETIEQHRMHRLSSTEGWIAPFTHILGLHGSPNSILTIGDTGVDHDSCFFHDDAHPVLTNRLAPDPNHRKIAGYHTASLGDDPSSPRAPAGDDLGHGTHTAGSLAGSMSWEGIPKNAYFDEYTFDQLSAYNGMANGSRLLIFDFHNPGDDSLYIPSDVRTEYLEVAYTKFGSRISSNSWGDTRPKYDSFTRDIEEWLYMHEDFLFVIAAGNDGAQGSHHIANPATAKNVLSVGASMNGVCSFFDMGYASGMHVLDPPELLGDFSLTPASFGAPFMKWRMPTPTPKTKTNDTAAPTAAAATTSVGVCFPQPPDACAPLSTSSASSCAGRVIFVERGGCTFTQKAQHVQEVGGLVMILLNSHPDRSFIMDAGEDEDVSHISIPLVTLDQVSSDRFRRWHFQHSTQPQAVDSIRINLPIYVPSASQSEHALSDFSSKGPTLDGRLKPDLVVPGEYIESARGDANLQSHQCVHSVVRNSGGGGGGGSGTSKMKTFNKDASIRRMEGTSMACPLAAGAAEIVRQYLTEGHYHEQGVGKRIISRPSAALIKAMMISGTAPVGGETIQQPGKPRVPVEPPPSYHQGFGRAELNEVLSYDIQASTRHAKSRSKYQLFLRDGVRIRSGEVHRYCFRQRTISPSQLHDPPGFKASIVWTDPPPTLPTSLFLVNNIDLMIVEYNTTSPSGSKDPNLRQQSASHRVWLGNQRLHSSTPHQLHFDVDNNVEKAIVEQPNPGMIYSVVVRGTHIPINVPDHAAAHSGSTGSTASSSSNRTDGQPYALVVNGDFDIMRTCPTQVYCPNDCSGHGSCIVTTDNGAPGSEAASSSSSSVSAAPNVGLCRCEPHWAGSDCSIAAQQLTPHNTPLTLDTQPDTWSYVYYDVVGGERNLTWTMDTSQILPEGQGDPDFYWTTPGGASDAFHFGMVAPAQSSSSSSPTPTPVPLSSFFTYPTLSYHHCSNMESDAAGITHHVQQMSVADLYTAADRESRQGGGTVMLGVWGYCCQPARVVINIQVQRA